MDNTCAFIIVLLTICFDLVHLAQSEEEMLRDQKEREELEQHLRDRDTARTRKVCLNLILGIFSCFGLRIGHVVIANEGLSIVGNYVQVLNEFSRNS